MSYDWPFSIGHDIGAVPVLKKIVGAGHHLIVMSAIARTPEDPVVYERFSEMIKWFSDNEIPYIGINYNPRESFRSDKITADLYIDDHCLGIPLKTDLKLSKRPFVDWEKCEILLKEMDIID